jgi:DNA transposition AAA+ family ATPase
MIAAKMPPSTLGHDTSVTIQHESLPWVYSRIGFVHEFRALDSVEMQKLLDQRWTPTGVTLPDKPLDPDVIAKLIRMTGGNFRLLTRILTQIERVLDVNQLHTVSTEVVEAARGSLVIGQG